MTWDTHTCIASAGKHCLQKSLERLFLLLEDDGKIDIYGKPLKIYTTEDLYHWKSRLI